VANGEVTGGRMAVAGTWRRENLIVAVGNGDRHIFRLYRRMNCRLQRIIKAKQATPTTYTGDSILWRDMHYVVHAINP